MLKFVFWALLAANAALLAYGQGVLGQPGAGEREPARLKNQLAPERITQLTAVEAKRALDQAEQEEAEEATQEAAPTPPTPTPAAPVAVAANLVACVQTGPFSAADARRFEARVASLDIAARQSRVEIPFQEVTSRLVYLPPNGGREGAQRRAAELKESGVENFYIMQGDSPLRWAISLGVFKTDSAAQKLVAQLQRQGVRGVQILPRGPQVMRAGYQYRAIEPPLRARLAGIADDYPNAGLRDCD
ncbi:SPOR domain-containing protein [Massilia sp. CFBP9012]|uniref:SPOR domain-containing protein n=1 Tax=Massilia sp. CFBP9012 TaxID=3096531 RepID=UPI002A6B59C8|nr:SPOR domain-containing protein [Massilia sp. CFBP9012]MDY0977858.1 SPOR domain-containing protein [Massilia sp. CFBP9012]